eukprot:7258018-Pyramimonas_sp.AAC.1
MHYLAFRRPPPLPSEVPHGPQPEPMDFKRVRAQLDAAFIRAKRGDDGVMIARLFREAYASWAGLAERELSRTLGVQLPVLGSRGKGPQTHWRPTL